jgi:hypothetical protein
MKTGRFYRSGSVIADGVEIKIHADYRRADGREGWRGEAWLPTEAFLIPGDRLRLEVDGGDKEDVEVVIDRVTVDSSAGRMLVRFSPLELP